MTRKQQEAREILQVLDHMYGTIRAAVRLGDLGALTLGVAVQRRRVEIEGEDSNGGELRRLDVLRESAKKERTCSREKVFNNIFNIWLMISGKLNSRTPISL